MNCKQCKKETPDRKDKKFCSVSCKKKYKYHNNKIFRERKIKRTIELQGTYKKLSELTLEDVEKIKLIRNEKL